MERVCFETMSDDRVLAKVEALVARSNQLTAELLAYLSEVDVRGLHLREACGSLFAFCVERLHMSEGAAGKRITAARVGRRFPLVLEMIARGEIHLTAVNMLAAHLDDGNHVELLERARHRSKREIEKLLAEIAPRSDRASRVRALPDRPGVVAPLSPRRYELRVTIDEEAHEALVRLQGLLAHQVPGRDPAVIVSRGLELLLERTLARKAAVTEAPRERAAPEKRTRHIPAAVRRVVWQRDRGQCAYVDRKGRRCSSTHALEYHHVRNWARGAEHDPAEMELRCRSHNQYQAKIDYGADFMAASRGSRAGERRGEYAPGRVVLAEEEVPGLVGGHAPGEHRGKDDEHAERGAARAADGSGRCGRAGGERRRDGERRDGGRQVCPQDVLDGDLAGDGVVAGDGGRLLVRRRRGDLRDRRRQDRDLRRRRGAPERDAAPRGAQLIGAAEPWEEPRHHRGQAPLVGARCHETSMLAPGTSRAKARRSRR